MQAFYIIYVIDMLFWCMMFQISLDSSGQLVEADFELHSVPKTNLFVGIRLGDRQSANGCTCTVSITTLLTTIYIKQFYCILRYDFWGCGHEAERHVKALHKLALPPNPQPPPPPPPNTTIDVQ